MARKHITFAFIKASEGSIFVDSCFQKNRANAAGEDIYVGAYHFFSFESAGKLQAEHFISTVGPLGASSLPPVIDIEYYNYKNGTDISKATVQNKLGAMIAALEEYYKIPPILYVTEKSYHDFIEGAFLECSLWVRSAYHSPRLCTR